MKIAFILPSLTNKGPVIVAYNVIKYLVEKVESIDVFYFDESATPLDFNCYTKKIGISENINFEKYDIIHSHTLRADVYLFKKRKIITNAKIISTLHQDTFDTFKMRYNRIVSFFLTNYWLYIQKHFDGVIAISNQLKDKYNLKLLNKVTTVYNGCTIDSPIVREEIKDSIQNYRRKGFKVLGTYASITYGKGLSQVIKVLTALPDYVFFIIGEGPYVESLKKCAKNLKVNDRVIFIPYVVAPYSYLEFMDIYMMPSYNEGFGLAMVEAALAKKAIVCSNIPAFNEIFDTYEVCFFELNNSSSLIQAIKFAYNNKDVIGNSAYIKSKKYFTAEIMAENHFEYYKIILKTI